MPESRYLAPSAAVLSITPLYHFSSDAPELVIDESSRILRFEESQRSYQFDEEFSNTLKISPPDYFLFQSSQLRPEFYIQDVSSESGHAKAIEAAEECVAGTKHLIRLLRLFCPGRLRAGETFLLRYREDVGKWCSLFSGRASQMTVDYFSLRLRQKTFALTSAELPALHVFSQHLLPVLSRISSFPAAEFALVLYGSDDGERSDSIQGITALESLLTKADETEGLSYRLSLRTANLLGNDVEARKAKFAEVRRFYNLRSKMVHGSSLSPKLVNQLADIDVLREIVRRVLLSVMALFSEDVRYEDLTALLDDLAFDEGKRMWVNGVTAKFLHVKSSS